MHVPSPPSVLFLASLSLLSSLSSAHFLLTYPKPIAYDYEASKLYPCGSFDVTTRKPNVTDFPIGGSPIAVNSTHDVNIWIFRAALFSDVQANKNNFKYVNLLPTIRETGAAGHFCEPNIVVPDEFEGKEGIIQVIQKAPGGSLLYACAAVNFKSGKFSGALPSACNNATGATASAISTSIPVPLPTATTVSDEATSAGSGPAATTSSSSSSSSDSTSIRSGGLYLLFLTVIFSSVATLCL